MNKKILYIIGILLVLLAIVFLIPEKKNTQKDVLTVGAVLPMTGPTAIYGEELKKGMEYAIKDLEKEGYTVNLIIEDSQATAPGGLSAYNKLVNSDNVDYVISALSRVSIPLMEKAKEDQIPLVITMVSAMDAVSETNPWVFRVFHNAKQTGGAHSDTYVKLGLKKIGVVYVNDEFGKSNLEVIKQDAAQRGIEVLDLAYLPTDSDYRTQLSKVKAANSDGLVFIGIPPTAVYAVRQQALELGLDIPFFETAGVLQISSAIQLLGPLAETVYSIGNPFNFMETGVELKNMYVADNGKEPSYAVSFGFDTMKIIGDVSKGGEYKGEEFLKKMKALEKYSGANSEYTANGKGEINPILYSAQVVNGKLEKLK